MSRLVRPLNTSKKEGNGHSCEACGRAFENPIQLTNLSSSPSEVYNACPFCFSKQSEVFEEDIDLSAPALEKTNEASEKSDGGKKSAEQFNCPHYVGYLKKRPKNSPIPEDCLTCEKMIQCLL